MTTEIIKAPADSAIAELSSKEAAIAKLKEMYAILPDMTTKDGYESGRKGIGELRTLRTGLEKRKLVLTAERREWIKSINTFVDGMVEEITKIEKPLKAAKELVDTAKERAAEEKANAERKAIEDELNAKRAAAEEEAYRLREAEAERLRKENERLELERAELDKQRAELAAQQKDAQEKIDAANRAAQAEIDRKKAEAVAEQRRIDEQQREQQARMDAEAKAIRDSQAAEQAKIEAEKEKIRIAKEAADRAEFEKQAKIKAEADAAEKAKRDKIEAERLAKQREEEANAEAARIEAMKPDVQKLRDFVKALSGMGHRVELQSEQAKETLAGALSAIKDIVRQVSAFCDKNEGKS